MTQTARAGLPRACSRRRPRVCRRAQQATLAVLPQPREYRPPDLGGRSDLQPWVVAPARATAHRASGGPAGLEEVRLYGMPHDGTPGGPRQRLEPGHRLVPSTRPPRNLSDGGHDVLDVLIGQLRRQPEGERARADIFRGRGVPRLGTKRLAIIRGEVERRVVHARANLPAEQLVEDPIACPRELLGLDQDRIEVAGGDRPRPDRGEAD